eukprot:tig00021127_g18873.t1
MFATLARAAQRQARADILQHAAESLKFKVKDLPPPSSASGWAPPAGGFESLPFRIHRSDKGQIPVYRDYRNGRTRVFTILRKIEGDPKLLAKDMSEVCYGSFVEVRPGYLRVQGDFATEIKEWVRRLGF